MKFALDYFSEGSSGFGVTKGKEYEEVIGEEWSDGMVSDNLLVLEEIIRSKVLPWTWVGEVTCCSRLNEVSSLFKDWIIGGLGMLKSPSMIVLEVILGINELNSSRNKLMLAEVGR